MVETLLQTKSDQTYKKETQSYMFRIQQILDGNTITVTPNWNWNGRTGNAVLINGYGAHPSLAADMRGFVGNVLRQRLISLLPVGTTVQLSNAISIDGQNRIVCDVIFNGVSVANYFPEYKL